MPFRYLPLLRSKTGEAVALSHLDSATKARLYPVVHLAEAVPATFGKTVSAAWSGLPLALDGSFNFDLTGVPANYTNLLQELGAGGVRVVPSVTAGAPVAYVNLIRPYVGLYAPGVLVKASLDQLPQVLGWLGQNGWSPSIVDLVIDLGDIAGYPSATFHPYVRQTIQTLFPAAAWRSVTLASASAPKDHGALPLGRTDVPRLCWQLWKMVSPQIGFHLDFGDYATGSPDLTEPPGIAMARATVSVRYTIDDHWIVLKGRPVGGATGQPMAQQYRKHAQALVADPSFNKLPQCWADQRIRQIATGASGPGNRQTWVSIAVNRHLCFLGYTLP